MKNSKFSNLGSSKTTTKHIQDTCEQHQGQPYTNFCSAMTCVRALCPQCIENHYIYHKNLRTQPQIDSFKSLRNKCLRKIGDILERLNTQQNQDSVNDLNAVFESSIRKIRQSRDHCRKIMDTYFTNLQDYVRKKMTGVLSEQSDMFQQLQKANSIVNELKILYQKVDDSKSFLSSAHTITKLDSEKIEQRVRQCYNTVNSLKDHYRGNLYVQKNYEQKIMNNLSKMFYYGNQQNMQSMPRVAQQLIIKNQMSLSRSSSRSKVDARQKNDKGGSKYQHSESQSHTERDQQSRKLKRKSSLLSQKPAKKNIIGMNTFKETKYLHFFQNDENMLHFLDLESDVEFAAIQLNINFRVPEFHKSIAVPNGDLYLIGGSLPNNVLKSQKIYKYDFQRKTLVFCTDLKYGRSSHSVCFNNKYIYVLGGFTNNQIVTKRCERYDILQNKVQEIRPMSYAVCSFACCSFNGRYIFKFGGISEDNSILHYIQIYDEKQAIWSVVNPSVQLQGCTLMSLSTSAAIQITQNQIMIMGGYDQSNEGQKQTYILKVESPDKCMIKDINVYPLPFAEGFWNNTPIIQNKLVFALQNVSMGQEECIEDLRRILVFDGSHWKCLNA